MTDISLDNIHENPSYTADVPPAESSNTPTTADMQSVLRDLAKKEVKRRFLDYKPYDKQKLFHKLGSTKRERALMAGNQLGKFCLINQTLTLRYLSNGLTEWVDVGEIKQGDYLIDGFGNPTKVLGVYIHRNKKFYRMTFDDGANICVGGEHLWKAKMYKKEKFPSYEYYTGEWGVYSTDEIIAFGGMKPCPRKRAYIPVCSEINTSDAPLPVDPYVMGQYLGNGYNVTNRSFHIAEQQDAIDELQKVIQEPITHRSRYDYIVSYKDAYRLSELGLEGKRSWEKFIPRIYLHASHEQRKALLQGLMDTDGSCSAPTDKLTGGDCEYSTSSEQLAKDIIELARSLGCKAKMQVRKPRYTYQGEKREGRTSYRIKIRCPFFNPFRLERKAKNWFRPTSTTDCRVLYKIEDAGYGDGVCFTVDSPDHTYIVQDYIVTHNTLSAAYEVAMHLTGRYPSWWEGKRYTKPIEAWAGGVTSLSVRDIIQDKLFGKDWRLVDDGLILPEDIIEDPTMARGVPGLMDTIKIRHASGGISILQLKSYEQGREKWQGTKKNLVWLDEEPPIGIYAEALARTNAAEGGMLLATFTPLMGMSEVVLGFWELGAYNGVESEKKNKNKALVLMGINDVGHYTQEQKDTIIASYPAFEREARANGIPSLGSGRVFRYKREDITADPMPQIPRHWPRIVGMDIGWDHPTAVCWIAWDRDTDTVYLYDCYKESEGIIGYHAGRIRAGGEWIPVAWPMDALQTDKQTGQSVADTYRGYGVNMLYEPATMEMEDGKLSNSVEASLFEMDKRMQTGRFKVAPHLAEFFDEFDLYHRDKGKIVKLKDDLISACRYGIMMLRYAETGPQGGSVAAEEPSTDWIV